MSDRFLPPGMTFTSQAYEAIIDNWMGVLKGAAWKALVYFCRRTVGFGKPVDAVSLSQLCYGIKTRNGQQLDRGTGLTREAALDAVRQLERLNLVTRTVRPNPKPALYGINWGVASQESQNPTSRKSRPVASRKSRPELVGLADPQLAVQPAVLQPTESRDLDCASVNRQKRDSQTRVSVPESACKKYPKLKDMLKTYMEDDEPSDRLVVDVMEAACAGAGGHATEKEVVKCLEHLFIDRGLQPGTENGPRHWAWFPMVVQDHFQKRADREEATHPCGYDEWAPRNETRQGRERIDAMTATLEIPPEAQ